MNWKILLSLLFMTALFCGGCKTNQKTAANTMTQTNNTQEESIRPEMMPVGGQGSYQGGNANRPNAMALAPIIIYKTKGDYRNLVPITLSADKKHVIARPAPGDLMLGDGFATPIELADGYLLDRRGVGPGTAFIEYTYKHYFAIKGIPTEEDLLRRIVDSDPFTEIYRCDRSQCNPLDIESMNKYIRSGKPGAVSLK